MNSKDNSPSRVYEPSQTHIDSSAFNDHKTQPSPDYRDSSPTRKLSTPKSKTLRIIKRNNASEAFPRKSLPPIVLVATDEDGILYVRGKDTATPEDEALLSAALHNVSKARLLFNDSTWTPLEDFAEHGPCRLFTLNLTE